MQEHSFSDINPSLVLLPTDHFHTTMVSSHGILLVILTTLALLTTSTADITDMIGEAICAAQCLTNFTLSVSLTSLFKHLCAAITFPFWMHFKKHTTQML